LDTLEVIERELSVMLFVLVDKPKDLFL
jgi:hypothetical protein